ILLTSPSLRTGSSRWIKRQISEGAAITVTHPDMTRYFMTIQEAVYLVTQATAMGKGGEVFVLDMGEPVRILDLAHSIIKLSGFEPEKDIPIKFTGLRPGEKLCEELFAENEVVNETRHPRIFRAVSVFDEKMVTEFLGELENAIAEGDDRRFTDMLSRSYIGRTA
ncbi:MAG: polysaccharide biosynthesis protein, partial [Actinobacteria bacterium]|nr:polysaccharide biosynthesis protein [Actinomycetota bacterium]